MGVPIQTVRRFHLARLLVWVAQIPLAVITNLKSSLVYLVFLSLAALVESAFTDYLQARTAEQQDPKAEI